MYASIDLIADAVEELGRWRDAVQQQTSSHLYSFLGPKWKGAQPGRPVGYSEADDREFWDAFFRVRSGDWPYFDPLKAEWRPDTQWHSNTATQRKNRFVTRWGAATWDDNVLTLAPDYAEIFASRVMTKAGRVTRIPTTALAIWMFNQHEMPSTERELAGEFREFFHFSSSEFAILFESP